MNMVCTPELRWVERRVPMPPTHPFIVSIDATGRQIEPPSCTVILVLQQKWNIVRHGKDIQTQAQVSYVEGFDWRDVPKVQA